MSSSGRSSRSDAVQRLARLAPGMLLCCLVAAAAAGAAILRGGPQMLYALAFGAVFHFQSRHSRTAPGITFCMGGVLRPGIGLLGARLAVSQVAALGWPAALVTVAAAATTLLCGVLVARALGLDSAIGAVAGSACAICGAAAALAVSAALPQHPAKHRSTLALVAMTTVCSTVATVCCPLVARTLGLTGAESGLFIGATLHDVAQVVVAGYALGPAAGDSATVVKLLRVSLLTLVVMGVSLVTMPTAKAGPLRRFVPPVPWFLWLFVAMAVLNSSGLPGPQFQHALVAASTASLMVGVVGLGMNTSFRGLASAGWRPVVLMIACSLWIAVFVLAAIGVCRYFQEAS